MTNFAFFGIDGVNQQIRSATFGSSIWPFVKGGGFIG
jgi:hypothetical protein